MKNHFLLLIFLLSMGVVSATAETIHVEGTVTDTQNGESLIGVSVVETGTTNGTVTDFDGNFSLDVEKGKTLTFSYMGYASVEQTAAPTMRIQLGEDSKELEELVVVGYQVQRKADLTGAVGVMDMSKSISEGNANMVSSLQGRLAGVQVSADAAPGAEGSSIRIRGISSINGSDPLYVIDGIATTENLNSLNPSDIESIQVLKDAASASIYGSRAANGVIVITTKRGRQAERARIDFHTQLGISRLAYGNWDQMNTA